MCPSAHSLNLLYEINSIGNVDKQYTYSADGLRVSMKIGNKTVFYQYNSHGDVVALTDEDGLVIGEYVYDAWGNIVKEMLTTEEARQNSFKYAGYFHDTETGMYYLNARYYEAKQGVFLSVDSEPGDEINPLTMNGYTYANNNPVEFIDADGEYAIGILIQVLKWGTKYVIKGGEWVFKGGKWVFQKGKNFYKKVTLPKPKFPKKQLQKKWKHAEDFGVKANYSAKNAHLFESALNKHIKGATEILDTAYRGGQKVTIYIKSGKGVIVDKKGNFISGWKMNAAQLKNYRKLGTRIK